MARAKRTDRTEARRRHRAEQAAESGGEMGEGLSASDAEAEEAAPARRKGAAPGAAQAKGDKGGAAAPRPARPSFTGAAKLAYRPAHVREDLALLPRLLVHWSVLASAGLAILGTAVFLAAGAAGGATPGTPGTGTTGTNTMGYLASMLVSLFVGPPPFGAALLIGFMLPRATYLAGFVFGLLASVCFTAIVLAQPAETAAGAPVAAILAQVWVLGPIGTLFFAAGIAWYKRFLDLLNPNRAQRGRAAQASGQGRGNAPKNRLSGSGR